MSAKKCGCEKNVFACAAHAHPARTPTPWKVDGPDWAIVGSRDGNPDDPLCVGQLFLPIHHGQRFDMRSANAAFIVRACNSYDKMLRQLKTIRLLYEKEMGILNTQELEALIAECEK